MPSIESRVKKWPEPNQPPRIPLAKPELGKLEKRNLALAFKSTHISGTGFFVEKSESQISEFLQTQALVVSNGSVALTLALRALEVKHGDEVIVPTFTYAATASAIVNMGATPRFVDSQLDSWNVHSEDIAKLITNKTKAIVVVDIYGNPVEMMKIKRLAEQKKIPIIQDSAEALGATYLNKPLGKFADISTYSFFANKIITCGEGGAVTTADQDLYERMKLLRGQGMSPITRYLFEEPGYNFRLSNLNAAILSAQLQRAEELIEKRFIIYNLYRKHLKIEFSEPNCPENSSQSPWLFSIRLTNLTVGQKMRIAKALAQIGIQTRPLFYPLHSMPAFTSSTRQDQHNYANAELISRQGISLPTYPSLSKSNIIEVADVINSIEKRR